MYLLRTCVSGPYSPPSFLLTIRSKRRNKRIGSKRKLFLAKLSDLVWHNVARENICRYIITCYTKDDEISLVPCDYHDYIGIWNGSEDVEDMEDTKSLDQIPGSEITKVFKESVIRCINRCWIIALREAYKFKVIQRLEMWFAMTLVDVANVHWWYEHVNHR